MIPCTGRVVAIRLGDAIKEGVIIAEGCGDEAAPVPWAQTVPEPILL